MEILAATIIIVLLVSMKPVKATANVEKRLTSMIICHLLVLVLDAARWFLSECIGISLLQAVLSAAPTILSLIGHANFVRFAIEFLSQKGSIPRKINYSLTAFFWLSILTWGAFILLNGFQSAANMQTNYQYMSYSWGYWVGHLSWATACIIGIWLIMRCRAGLTGAEILSLLSYCVFPLLALALRFFWDGAQIFLSTSLALIWISVVAYRDQQQRLSEKESQLAQSRIAIILSYIKPEFLDKILTNIRDQCDVNAKEAKNLTVIFADFLRYNLEAVNQSESICFKDELLHTQRYVNLEKTSHGNKLRVNYNIGANDFYIPSLTLQPLIENAIMQGLLQWENGCEINITTREAPKSHEILIVLKSLCNIAVKPPQGENLSLNVENVKARLWLMCKGTVTVAGVTQSEIVATIAVPKPTKVQQKIVALKN